jgi:hypothetical protein
MGNGESAANVPPRVVTKPVEAKTCYIKLSQRVMAH